MENKSLFHIKTEYLDLINKIDLETGEIPDDVSQALAINESELLVKSESYVAIIKKLEADMAMFEDYEKQAKAHKDRAKKRIELLKANLKDAVDLYGTIVTDLYTVGTRKSESVVISDEEKIPAAYYTLEKKFDKMLIKNNLKKGDVIPGASLVKKDNLSIK